MEAFLTESRNFIKSLEAYSYFTRSQDILGLLESDGESSMQEAVKVLALNAKNITSVALGSKSALKNKDFKFMESIVLYGGLLRLDVFKNEPKRAKVEMCKGLLKLYGSVKQIDSEALDEISKNPTIMKLADSVGTTLKSTDIDPQEMLAALLSGKPLDAKYQKFVESLEADIKDLKLDASDVGAVMSLLGGAGAQFS